MSKQAYYHHMLKNQLHDYGFTGWLSYHRNGLLPVLVGLLFLASGLCIR